jgi:hypothetical protein
VLKVVMRMFPLLWFAFCFWSLVFCLDVLLTVSGTIGPRCGASLIATACSSQHNGRAL